MILKGGIDFLGQRLYTKVMKVSIKKIWVGLVFSGLVLPAHATNDASPIQWLGASWDQAVTHVSDTWREGDWEAYAPVWTHHMRFHYDQDRLDDYTEFPAGVGIGKGRYNDNGNYEGMYAMGFLDSHGDPSYMAGYAWIPTWQVGQSEVKAGIGMTGFLMSRQDYNQGIPFPGILPVASVSYKNLAIQGAYIPGISRNSGNVFFVWGKWTFN